MDKSPQTFSDELISAYLDDELTDDERVQVEDVLAQSAVHRQMFDELRALRESMRTLPRYQLGSAFQQRVLRQLPSAPAREERGDDQEIMRAPSPTPPQRGFRRGLVWSAAAVVAAALVMLFAQQSPRVLQPSTTGGSSPTDSDVHRDGVAADSVHSPPDPSRLAEYPIKPDEIWQIELPAHLLENGAFEKSLQLNGITLQALSGDQVAARGQSASQGRSIYSARFVYVRSTPSRIRAVLTDFETQSVRRLASDANSIVVSEEVGSWALNQLRAQPATMGQPSVALDDRRATEVITAEASSSQEPRAEAAPLPFPQATAAADGRHGTAVRLYLGPEPTRTTEEPQSERLAARAPIPGEPSSGQVGQGGSERDEHKDAVPRPRQPADDSPSGTVRALFILIPRSDDLEAATAPAPSAGIRAEF
jgi:hypothetical protein